MTYSAIMAQADCKVLSLWNGSTNVTPPTNWDTVAFDDSAWAASAAVVPVAGTSHRQRQYVNGTAPGLFGYNGAPPSGAEAVWPTTAPVHAAEEILIRWRFNLPTIGPFTNDETWIYDSTGANGGLSTGVANVNGAGQFNILSAFSWNLQAANLLTNAQNLFALWVNSGNTGSASTWDAEAWVSMQLVLPDAVIAAAAVVGSFVSIVG